jgi:pyrimidine-nucleoside phosphorylase
MVDTGNNCGRKTAAIITDMSAPLGRAIGNSLELVEVIQLLSGEKVSKNLLTLCEELSANMLLLAKKGTLDECRALAKEAVSSGRALKKLADMVEAQGGDRSYIESPSKFEKAPCITEVVAPRDGYIGVTNTEGIGLAAMSLGAGRNRPEDKIDFAAGIILNFEPNDYVKKGQVLAHLHASAASLADKATEQFLSSLSFSEKQIELPPLIYEYI